MPPSVAVSFVEEATRDGLSQREAMLLAKFEHAAHCFLPFCLTGCGWRWLDGRFLGERKKIRLQRHAAGMSARKETRFNLGPQVKGDGHGYLLLGRLQHGTPRPFSPLQPKFFRR